MKILITADLHYDIARSRRPAERLAERIRARSADALVLLGDTAGAALDAHHDALALFEGFTGRKLLVPGNHCLWCNGEESSLDRYRRILPQLAAEHGFELLDHSPVVMDGLGLAGSIGWYDYSFADKSLGIPGAFYEAKVAPGAAQYMGGYEDLIEDHKHQLTERHLALGSQWMDGVRVRLGMSDKEFSSLLAEKLAGQLAGLSRRVEQIAVFLHHLPFSLLVPANRPDRFAFAAAYMGAGRLGEVLLDCPKVTRVYCGHSHFKARLTVGRLTVINVGSTYTDKRLEVLEV